MIIRRTQPTSTDRPFPDENTVEEMYCNEALTIDNEAVEDWTSSLQMLLTFAAIFSAVLITLIVDSKTMLKQDNSDIVVDALVFFMNNLANGTHRLYTPPKFEPPTYAIAVNCLFFASLCLSIATALAAVLAMQWVTDYGAVTRRAGSTPEERVKRRHFRYQGGLDWRLDMIIGALPILLHVSVLLFFVGLIVWMWGVDHFVFGVVIVCGTIAGLFYIITTALAVLCPTCPYRTPLASWTYSGLHLLVKGISFLSLKFMGPRTRSQGAEQPNKLEGMEAAESIEEPRGQLRSKFKLLSSNLQSRFSQPSLTLRDAAYVQSPNRTLMKKSLIWLSNSISISPDVYQRLLVLLVGFAAVVDKPKDASIVINVPWNKILHALGSTYISFLRDTDLNEGEFSAFLRRLYPLSRPYMRHVFESRCRPGEEENFIHASDQNFPIHVLHLWTQSVSRHSITAMQQRATDEIMLHDLIRSTSADPVGLLKTWLSLLHDEKKTCLDMLPQLLEALPYAPQEVAQQRLDATLYIISTGRMPWSSREELDSDEPERYPSNPLYRRLRLLKWVDALWDHPHRDVILERLATVQETQRQIQPLILRKYVTTDEELAELRMRAQEQTKWAHTEEVLLMALTSLDDALVGVGDRGVIDRRCINMLRILCHDLMSPGVAVDAHYLDDMRDTLPAISTPILRLLAHATMGFPWEEEWFSQLQFTGAQNHLIWLYMTQICLKDPPFITGGDIWKLRLRLWIHMHSGLTSDYLMAAISDLEKLSNLEHQLQSADISIADPGDFLLAFIYLNHTYAWDCYKSPKISIVNLLVGDSAEEVGIPRECVKHLSGVCHSISDDPARLIRLLIELIRADINHDPVDRRPQTLFELLRHGISHLTSKDLRSFVPSCKRLIRYINESYKQFEDAWDNILSREPDDNRFDYRVFNSTVFREELGVAYKEAIALLSSQIDGWSGEQEDVSWPREYLRPTGTKIRPFIENAEETQ